MLQRLVKLWPFLKEVAWFAVAVAAVLAVRDLADATREVGWGTDRVAGELRGIQYAVSETAGGRDGTADVAGAIRELAKEVGFVGTMTGGQ